MMEFSQILKEWYRENKINHPWKEDRDPYKIWVSEIILQQTRVSQGTPYYHTFLKAFPSIQHLADTTEERLFAIWEGLGYYRRASNMLKGARYIVEEHQGLFPKTYDGLLAIPGIGPYTAAAIGSFAFDNPTAVVDGNVNRVISRLFNIDEDLTKSAAKKKILEKTQNLLASYNNPAEFNQAIMDFGANVCTPKAKCDQCPASSICQAIALDKVNSLPYKKRKKAKRKRSFHFAIIKNAEDKILVEQRKETGIWAKMYQFPLIESEATQLSLAQFAKAQGQKLILEKKSKPSVQELSHQQITAQFYHFKYEKGAVKNGQIWATQKQLSKLAFPRVIRQYIEQVNI